MFTIITIISYITMTIVFMKAIVIKNESSLAYAVRENRYKQVKYKPSRRSILFLASIIVLQILTAFLIVEEYRYLCMVISLSSLLIVFWVSFNPDNIKNRMKQKLQEKHQHSSKFHQEKNQLIESLDSLFDEIIEPPK